MSASHAHISVETVLEATSGIRLDHAPALTGFSAVGIDGRTLPPGGLFVALRGERHDGHAFARQAVEQGARGVLCEPGRGGEVLAAVGDGVCVVESPLDGTASLTALARRHRNALSSLRIVGVVGSNGKTTTKEMIAQICIEAFGPERVCKTAGNLNNHLGVPLTLLGLRPEHAVAVVEMGTSGPGEIAHLGALVRPDVAVVVSIGAEHLETLGSLAGVAAAEAEIFDHVGADGVVVVPAEERLLDPHLARVRGRLVTFGTAGSDTRASVEVRTAQQSTRGLYVQLTGEVSVISTLATVGVHNAGNAACAAAAAHALGIDDPTVSLGLSNVRPAWHRAQLVPVGDRTLLDDCYNASPPSMSAALDALTAISPKGKRRVAVLGDMLELGPDGPLLHRAMGAQAASCADVVITVGPLARELGAVAAEHLGPRAHHAGDDPAAAALRAAELAYAESEPGSVILFKGSRGMRLERAIDALATLLGAPSPASEAH
jgi:UDP-N-acetylmuramoyl-tripeptide--D-alanyl-D-alanine ligase